MNFKERTSLVCFSCLAGIPVGTIYLPLKIKNSIEIRGKLPQTKEGIIIAFNHPTFLDPVIIALLDFPRCLCHPARLIPLGVPAKEEYYDKKWFWPLRPFCLPLKRNGGSHKEILQKMIGVLNGGRRIAFPLEGGRTDKGTEFLYSQKRRRIRKPQDGVGFVAVKSGAKVVPVWIEIVGKQFPAKEISFSEIRNELRQLWQGESKMIVKIGQSFRVEAKTRQVATQIIAQALLATGEEIG